MKCCQGIKALVLAASIVVTIVLAGFVVQQALASETVVSEVSCGDPFSAGKAASVLESHLPFMLLNMIDNGSLNCAIHIPSVALDVTGEKPVKEYRTHMYGETSLYMFKLDNVYWFVPEGYSDWHYPPEGSEVEGVDI